MNAKTEKEETKTLVLRTPIQAHGEMLCELTLHRPRGKDLRKLTVPDLQKVTYPDMLKYLEVCGRIPPSAVDEMDGADVVDGFKLVTDFLANSQPGGKTSVPN